MHSMHEVHKMNNMKIVPICSHTISPLELLNDFN
jgi:hypothetical protein